MEPELQTTADTHTKVWTASNVFSVLAMGVGSVGYGKSLAGTKHLGLPS